MKQDQDFGGISRKKEEVAIILSVDLKNQHSLDTLSIQNSKDFISQWISAQNPIWLFYINPILESRATCSEISRIEHDYTNMKDKTCLNNELETCKFNSGILHIMRKDIVY